MSQLDKPNGGKKLPKLIFHVTIVGYVIFGKSFDCMTTVVFRDSMKEQYIHNSSLGI